MTILILTLPALVAALAWPPEAPVLPTDSVVVAMKPVSRQTWNFDNVPANQLPEGFVAHTGTWTVVTDDRATSGDRVLAQQASNADDVFNVVLVSGTRYTDVDMSVKLRAVEGRVDQGGGVVWRAADGKNYYIARYNPLEDNFRVYKVVNGHRRMLDSAKLRLDHGAWHTLRVVMQGDHIVCYLDGTKYLDTHDSTFTAAGRIGLWTKADARTHFDDLAVAGPQSTGESQ